MRIFQRVLSSGLQLTGRRPIFGPIALIATVLMMVVPLATAMDNEALIEAIRAHDSQISDLTYDIELELMHLTQSQQTPEIERSGNAVPLMQYTWRWKGEKYYLASFRAGDLISVDGYDGQEARQLIYAASDEDIQHWGAIYRTEPAFISHGDGPWFVGGRKLLDVNILDALQDGRATVHPEPIIEQGHECILLEGQLWTYDVHGVDGGNFRILLDRAFGFMPRRIEFFSLDEHGKRTNLRAYENYELNEVAPGIWFPVAWDIKTQRQVDGELHRVAHNSYRIHELVRVNQGLSDDQFVVDFPMGTRVLDRLDPDDDSAYIEYIVGGPSVEKYVEEKRLRILEARAAKAESGDNCTPLSLSDFTDSEGTPNVTSMDNQALIEAIRAHDSQISDLEYDLEVVLFEITPPELSPRESVIAPDDPILSFEYKWRWKGEKLYQAQSVDGVLEYERSYDGEQSRSLHYAFRAIGLSPSGYISRKQTTLVTDPQGPRGVAGRMLAEEQLLEMLQDGRAAVQPEQIVEQGHECILVEGHLWNHPEHGPGGHFKLWLDPKCGFMPRRFELVGRDQNGELLSEFLSYDYELVEVAPGIWYPVAWEIESAGLIDGQWQPLGHNRYRIKSPVRVNQGLSDDQFVVDFPLGARILYRIDPDDDSAYIEYEAAGPAAEQYVEEKRLRILEARAAEAESGDKFTALSIDSGDAPSMAAMDNQALIEAIRAHDSQIKDIEFDVKLEFLQKYVWPSELEHLQTMSSSVARYRQYHWRLKGEKQYLATYREDELRFEDSYDGKIARQFSHPIPGQDALGTVYRTKPSFISSGDHPWVIAGREMFNEKLLDMLQDGRAAVYPQQAVEEGHACIRVNVQLWTQEEHGFDGGLFKLWLDPECGFMPRRIESFSLDEQGQRTNFREYLNYELNEVESGVWYPIAWDITTWRREDGELQRVAHNRYRAKSPVRVNQGLSDDQFVVDFPLGTRILYRIDPDDDSAYIEYEAAGPAAEQYVEEKRLRILEVRAAEAESGDNKTALLSSELPGSEAIDSGGEPLAVDTSRVGRSPLLLMGSIGLACLGLIMLAALRKRRLQSGY